MIAKFQIENYVEVIDSFKLSDEKIIALLQCYPDKLDGPLELSNSNDQKWILKHEIKATGNYDAYVKDEHNAKRNIFQYFFGAYWSYAETIEE